MTKPVRWWISAAFALVAAYWVLGVIELGIYDSRKGQIFTREMAAIKAIGLVHVVEAQYQAQYGRYACSLAELGPAIGNDLAGGIKQGYKFTLACTQGGYVINANPVAYNSDGNRTFYSDETMVIHENYGPEPATANSRVFR